MEVASLVVAWWPKIIVSRYDSIEVCRTIIDILWELLYSIRRKHLSMLGLTIMRVPRTYEHLIPPLDLLFLSMG
jgi:hypothetical protein